MPDSQGEAADKLEIPILFTPRDIKSYSEVVTFDFNKLYKVDVIVKGEGIPLQLELKDPDQAFLDFGIVSVGGDVTNAGRSCCSLSPWDDVRLGRGRAGTRTEAWARADDHTVSLEQVIENFVQS